MSSFEAADRLGMPDAALAYAVVIPAYNAGPHIGDAIRSVQSQSTPPWEVIVVDDGSSDDTGTIAESAGAKVVRVPQARGPSAARNAGVAASRSKVIGFLDADDEWLPHHAALLLSALGMPDTVFAGSNAELFGDARGVVDAGLEPNVPLDLRDLLLTDNPVIQSSVFVRRDAFDEVGGYDESLRMSEDFDLWHRLSERGRYVFVAAQTIRRRIHDRQATQSAVALVRSGWQVRRRVFERRRPAVSDAEWAAMLSRVEIAARTDVAYAVWSGSRDILRAVREELEMTDALLGLKGSFAARHGRSTDDLKCTLRGVLRRVLGRQM